MSCSKVKHRSVQLWLLIRYNQQLRFHNANFVTCVYVQLHSNQTSVCAAVKIKTPSAFSTRMRIKNYFSDYLTLNEVAVPKHNYKSLGLLYTVIIS